MRSEPVPDTGLNIEQARGLRRQDIPRTRSGRELAWRRAFHTNSYINRYTPGLTCPVKIMVHTATYNVDWTTFTLEGKIEMLKVWGRASSNNVQKVTWCCGELGLLYERVDVGGTFGGTDTPEYRAMNPNGLVPTISEDGFTLWESNATVRYLSASHGAGTLCPESLRERALADKWMDWQMGTFWAAFRAGFLGVARTRPEERNPDAIRSSLQHTAEALTILDDHLSNTTYVAGESLTMGDVALGPTVYRWLNIEIDRPPMPNLEAWHQRLTERPAYRENVVEASTFN